MARPDPHSVFDDAQPRVRRLDWHARFDFAARVVEAEARLSIEGQGDWLVLAAPDLPIERISDGAGAGLDFELGAPQPFVGQRLRIARAPAEGRIRYRTAPAAMALHWFNQSVYSQCQPIYARTLVPLPDSPSSRIAWQAHLDVPEGLVALVSASERPMAPYLFAFAVGDYVARELSPRSRVWAAPALADEAARALGDVERTLVAAERLLGRHPWQRFDVVIAPPSFPHGGMENPQLAF